jgi:hypothetical protein
VTRNWSALKLMKLAIAAVAALGTLALGAGSAAAAPRYVYVSSFGSLNLAVGAVVDNSSGPSAGDVFGVAKEGPNLQKFDKEGNPVNFTELGTNVLTGAETPAGAFHGPTDGAVDSTGNIYVVDEEYAALPEEKGLPVAKFDDTTGKYIALPAGAFKPPAEATTHGPFTPFGITIDNSTNVGDPNKGDVFVTDHTNHAVDKFTASGTFIAQFGAAKLSGGNAEPDTIGVDAEGNTYVSNRRTNVQKFGPTGTFLTTLDENLPQSVAVDASDGHVFVGDNANEGEPGHPHIEEYDATGEPVRSFGEEAPALQDSFYGMDVNTTTHSVYTSNINTGSVDRFEIGETPPVPVTLAPTEVKGNTATFNGTVAASGENAATSYHFEYNALVCTGGTATTAEPVTEATVKTEATGLAPLTTYKVCVVASNPFGPTLGNEVEFTTTAAKPVIESQVASEETKTTANVSATINPSGAETTCKVEYGETEAYGAEAPCPAGLGEGVAGVPVSPPIELTGLEPGKEYHYRFVAVNSIEEVSGADATFKTKPLVEPTTEAASEIGSESAKLNGKIKTGSEAAHYYFAYSKEGEGLTSKTPEVEVAAETEVSVSAVVNGLAAGETPYEFELVAVVGAETISGGVLKFNTLVSKPVVTNKSPSGVTRTTATVAAEINTENSNTEYKVEYGLNTEYKSGSTSLASTPAKEGPTSVSQALSGLEAGKVYHYRFVATNGTGTTQGPDGTFETEAPKLPIIESESSAQVTQTTATINGTINPNGLQTTYTLELGTDTNYGTPVFGEVGSGTEGEPLAFALTSLLPGTTYHFRFVAQNEDGTTFGEDQTFTTGSFPPVIVPPTSPIIVPTPPAEKVTLPKPPKEETRAQKYKKALKLCKKKPKSKRAACQRKAKKQFGPVAKKKGKKKKK